MLRIFIYRNLPSKRRPPVKASVSTTQILAFTGVDGLAGENTVFTIVASALSDIVINKAWTMSVACTGITK